MKLYIYKIIIASVAIILVFKFTIGNEIAQINKKINFFSSADGRKQIVNSIKKEIKKANQRENYLDEEERILLKNFIRKIQNELK
tara:strand:- start:1148 stop:1402 length:255 start_codon:yes stop_codon:yes gene_type:complete